MKNIKKDYKYFVEESVYFEGVCWELIGYLSDPEIAKSSPKDYAGYTFAILADEEPVYETRSHHAASVQFGVYVCPQRLSKKTSCVI